ncbi:unnamed protein product [Caenorhabditis sp. 36 PRJEB53466]|nr:unnamed protein product [Caenorhabditis sp. 36 PRJEB53466]
MALHGRLFRTVVYNAASDGKLERIMVFTENQRANAAWLHECLNADFSDQYPLVIAARKGHTAVVDYLLDLGADPSVRGIVEFDNDNIQGTPPLWAAAAAGHLDIVKLLVEKANADVNQTTNTQSTPLRGACYDGHVDIVEYLLEAGANPHIPNRHGHTCLMIAAYRNKPLVICQLLDHGIDVNTQTEKGNSALHDAAESGNVEVVNLLLKAGANMLPDVHGVNPLICAAQSGCAEVVNVLSASVKCAISRRDALKLLGSTLLDKKMDAMSAMMCWRKAMDVPLNKNEQKVVREMETFCEVKPVYDNLREIQHDYDVEMIDGNLEAQRMQSLIIRERILGGAHSDVHYYLRFRGAVYCDMGQMDKCYALWKHALELQQKHFSPLHHGSITTLQSFQDTFVMTLNDHVIDHRADRSLRVKPSLVEYVFNSVCHELERVQAWGNRPILEDTECCGHDNCAHVSEEGEIKKLVLVAVELVNVLDRLSLPSPGGEEEAKEENVKLNLERLVTICEALRVPLLHYALEEKSAENPDMLGLPKAAVLQQLLDMRIDVNAADRDGNTPLHILLRARKLRRSLLRALLSRGAWLYARNKEGVVVMEEMRRMGRMDGWNMSGTRLGRYITLAGITANAMRSKYEGMFDGTEELVPRDIRRFYMAH